MLSPTTLRLLHRLLDDFVMLGRVRSGAVSAAQLERALRNSGAEPQDIQEILAEYRRHRRELQVGSTTSE